jgi:hypothetical protein
MAEQRWIIASLDGYWNNQIGWVEHNDDATVFTTEEKETLDLPIGDRVQWEPVMYISFEEIEHAITERGTINGDSNKARGTEPGSVSGETVQGSGESDTESGE